MDIFDVDKENSQSFLKFSNIIIVLRPLFPRLLSEKFNSRLLNVGQLYS